MVRFVSCRFSYQCMFCIRLRYTCEFKFQRQQNCYLKCSAVTVVTLRLRFKVKWGISLNSVCATYFVSNGSQNFKICPLVDNVQFGYCKSFERSGLHLSYSCRVTVKYSSSNRSYHRRHLIYTLLGPFHSYFR